MFDSFKWKQWLLKGLCRPRRMRTLMRSTLKSLAQLFQIPLESLGSCFHLFESRSSSEGWLNVLFTNVLLLQYFWTLLQRRKSKNPATSCTQISLNRTLLRMCPSWHSPIYELSLLGQESPGICSGSHGVVLAAGGRPQTTFTSHLIALLHHWVSPSLWRHHLR